MVVAVECDEDISPSSPFPAWIETSRLRLTPLHETRASTLFNLFQDTEPRVFEYTALDTVETIADAFDILEHAARGWHEQRDAFYLVRRSSDATPIGVAAMTNIDWERRRLETGIVLHPSYWGEGYATERLLAFYDVAFGLYDFDHVVSVVQLSNTQSRTAVRKAIELVDGSVEGHQEGGTSQDDAPADTVQYVVSKKQYDIYVGDRRED